MKEFVMKKTILSLSVLLTMMTFCQTSRAQVFVDGKNINADSTVDLLEVVAMSDPYIFSIQSVDIGKKKPYKFEFTNQDGKKIHFNSTVDLIQFMTKNHWEMIDRRVAFRSRHNTDGDPFVFILFRKKP